jgi:hypothetical protein
MSWEKKVNRATARAAKAAKKRVKKVKKPNLKKSANNLKKKVKAGRTVSDRRDGDAARDRRAGKRHTSHAGGTSHGQRVGRYSSTEKRTYTNQDRRLLAALKEIRASRKCSDETATRICLQRGYARRAGQGLVLMTKGVEYIRHGKDY